jgi:hypothetical protein
VQLANCINKSGKILFPFADTTISLLGCPDERRK